MMGVFLQDPEMIHLTKVCVGGREHVFPALRRQTETSEMPGFARGRKTRSWAPSLCQTVSGSGGAALR